MKPLTIDNAMRNAHRLARAALLVTTGLGLSACLLGLGAGTAGEVAFEEPADGAQVVSPFTVRMSTADVTVEQAGAVREGYGHHHILVDTELPPLDRPIPADSQHLHFGAGQTEVVLDLPPGEHTLRLLFATGDHVPYDPAITDTVTVTVTARRAVSFVEPSDGARVTSPFTVRMATEGLTVEPAGTVREGHGHHHILVDTPLPPLGLPIPSDDRHRHFGQGQTETTLDLPPGEHTLTLLFAGGDHVPYAPAVSRTIKVTVVE